jgi:hypothetical protein
MTSLLKNEEARELAVDEGGDDVRYCQGVRVVIPRNYHFWAIFHYGTSRVYLFTDHWSVPSYFRVHVIDLRRHLCGAGLGREPDEGQHSKTFGQRSSSTWSQKKVSA